MAQCKNCEQTGWFLSLNASGVCDKCAPFVKLDVEQRVRIINDSLKLIRESKNVDVKASRCDLLLSHAEALLPYEKRGITTLNPAPSSLINTYKSKRNAIIKEALEAEANSAILKAGVSASSTSKINLLTKVLLHVQEYKGKVSDSSILKETENMVSRKVAELHLNSYLDKAKMEEFKGNTKKALDHYYEALYFLKNDECAVSLQNEHAQIIEQKIKDLGGELR